MVTTLNVQSILSRLPIPFIFAASAWISSTIATYLPLIPSTVLFDGTSYSTVAVVTGLSFVVEGALWVHSELQVLYPSLGGTTTVVAPSVSTTTSTSATSSNPAGVPAGATLVTAANVGYTVNALGVQTPNTPIGSYVFYNSVTGFYDVYGADGKLSISTTVDPLND